jgi:hypothetical protein
MRVSVQITVSVVALASAGILAASVALVAISTERQQRPAAEKAASELREAAR